MTLYNIFMLKNISFLLFILSQISFFRNSLGYPQKKKKLLTAFYDFFFDLFDLLF